MKDSKPVEFDTSQALLLAIDIEQRGYKFYTEAARATKDPRGRAMFQRLAQDEVRHLDWLTGHKESLEKTGKWKAIQLTGEALSLGGRVFPKTAGPRSGVKAKTRELAALSRGMQAEKDSMAFYKELAEAVIDLSGRATFQRLAEEEEKHYLLLQAEHDYLSRSGFYFDTPEFSLEGLE